MNFLYVTQLNHLQKQAVMQIWNNVYPAQLTHNTLANFEKYLVPLHNDHHILVQNEDQDIVGWLVTFDRQQERWFAMLMADRVKGQGIGSELLRQAKTMNEVLNGWVVDHNHYKRKDGTTYLSPLGFYIKNEFEVLKENRLQDSKLSVVQVRWEQ
ncbi:MAG TPA: N-acetyltransferase [Microscillaceae bacterium]|nr:N-acetyltransferase [Microscillaceae bacterium]